MQSRTHAARCAAAWKLRDICSEPAQYDVAKVAQPCIKHRKLACARALLWRKHIRGAARPDSGIINVAHNRQPDRAQQLARS
jgi:hypothetical protein